MLFVILAAGATGCNKGINTGTGGGPQSFSSPTPAEVSSSSQVVKVECMPLQITEGGSAEATVKLTISPGFHINANPATFPYLIPTEVSHAPGPDGFCATAGKPIYPAAAKAKFAFAEEPLAVYEGDVEVKLPIRLPRSGEKGCDFHPGKGTPDALPIKVRIQACDHEKCFPPANIDATIPVEVK